MKSDSCLIQVSIDFVLGSKRLKEIIMEIQKLGKVTAGSSVYKRFLNSRAEDLNSELCLVLRLEAETQDLTLINALRAIERKEEAKAKAEERILLLSYNQLVRVVPGYNLPHPILHGDATILRCAAEAWGNYHHPVLGQTLTELVRSEKSNGVVEFYSQFDQVIGK